MYGKDVILSLHTKTGTNNLLISTDQSPFCASMIKYLKKIIFNKTYILNDIYTIKKPKTKSKT